MMSKVKSVWPTYSKSEPIDLEYELLDWRNDMKENKKKEEGVDKEPKKKKNKKGC